MEGKSVMLALIGSCEGAGNGSLASGAVALLLCLGGMCTLAPRTASLRL